MELEKIRKFEEGLNPINLERSTMPASILGYGEISTVFQMGDEKDIACKRMPLFSDRAAAESYANSYREYCQLLREAGLKLPDDETTIVEIPGRPVVFYILQKKLNPSHFAHKLIHTLDREQIGQMIERIVAEISKVWEFNRSHAPERKIALDGQLSNWVFEGDVRRGEIFYVDTSTPLFRVNGEEQLDPELFLKSAPSFLRWIIRWLFLEDVMNRYYDQRQVLIDLVANLHKEQRPDLVSMVVDIVNKAKKGEIAPLSREEVEKYYREDKIIWEIFLIFRKLDRWIKVRLLRKRYEFILPGEIKR